MTIYGPRSAGAPFVATESTNAAGTTSETLNASIVPLGHNTTCTFQYVDSTDFLMQRVHQRDDRAVHACRTWARASLPQQASATVTGLTLGTFYHFHVVATNSAGTTTGADQTFQAGPGLWTPFNRCPVDDPAMLAADGVEPRSSVCVASNSTHGSITIGTTTTLTGNTNLQIGLVANENTGVFTVVAPAGGAVISDPVDGHRRQAVTVTATVESAGTPSDFDLIAGSRSACRSSRSRSRSTSRAARTAWTWDRAASSARTRNPIVLHPENTDMSNAMAELQQIFDPRRHTRPERPARDAHGHRDDPG